MSERLRTETSAVAWSDRGVLRRTDIRFDRSDEAEVDRFSIEISERNSEILAAQIHHLIRKRFCHLSRKIQ
jgi:hypothetical protein